MPGAIQIVRRILREVLQTAAIARDGSLSSSRRSARLSTTASVRLAIWALSFCRFSCRPDPRQPFGRGVRLSLIVVGDRHQIREVAVQGRSTARTAAKRPRFSGVDDTRGAIVDRAL